MMLEMKTLIGQIRPFTAKTKKTFAGSVQRHENEASLSEENSTNENDAQDSPKRGDDIIVPEISQSDERNESLSPRGGKCNLRPYPHSNYSEDFRYRKEVNFAQK